VCCNPADSAPRSTRGGKDKFKTLNSRSKGRKSQRGEKKTTPASLGTEKRTKRPRSAAKMSLPSEWEMGRGRGSRGLRGNQEAWGGRRESNRP